MQVTFWFDPGCPWSWVASRWLVDVTEARDVTVQWWPFSLTLNEAQGRVVDEDPLLHGTHAGLRVIEAARRSHGENAVGDLYTALGTRVHHRGDTDLAGLPDAIADAGLDPALADAAHDHAYDEDIRASMSEAQESAGEDVGTPLMRFGGPGMPVFFGPILSPAPTGEAALQFYDGLAAVATVGADGFYEFKRTRDGGPELPPRPG